MQELKRYRIRIECEDKSICDVVEAWFDERLLLGDILFAVRTRGKIIVVDPETPAVYEFDSVEEIFEWLFEDEDQSQPDIIALKNALRDGKISFKWIEW